jgi:hypothetical protein
MLPNIEVLLCKEARGVRCNRRAQYTITAGHPWFQVSRPGISSVTPDTCEMATYTISSFLLFAFRCGRDNIFPQKYRSMAKHCQFERGILVVDNPSECVLCIYI